MLVDALWRDGDGEGTTYQCLFCAILTAAWKDRPFLPLMENCAAAYSGLGTVLGAAGGVCEFYIIAGVKLYSKWDRES